MTDDFPTEDTVPSEKLKQLGKKHLPLLLFYLKLPLLCHVFKL